MPLIVPFATSLVAESGPITGGLEPGETVTVTFTSATSAPWTRRNLIAKLLPTGGVKDPSDQQNTARSCPLGRRQRGRSNSSGGHQRRRRHGDLPAPGRFDQCRGALWVSSLLPSGLAAPDTREPERHRHTFQWPRGALSIVRPSVRPGRRCQQRHRHALKREPLVPGGP